MSNIRIHHKEKYFLPKHRLLEIYHYCLQYNDWKEELATLTDTVRGIDPASDYVSKEPGDATATLAIRRAELSGKCDVLEMAAKEADPEMYEWIIKGTTNEGFSFDILKAMGMPCERDRYYDRRRCFYWLLSQKIK